MLGVAFITGQATELSRILLNFIPYLQRVYGKAGGVDKYVLLHLIKLYSEKIIRAEFVGSRGELQEMLDQINNINVGDPNAIQKTLQPAIDLTGIRTLEDRRRWLYLYEEI
ncbi:hypothetical protein FO440_21990 [Mucilaginibacter corticis]|uniref:Uncharacterized protein n=1 Tax=Mucilaginibacter corticis TaxID=2597670 RepID=A0A556M9I0_9SPHI|nr:hypothetical protein [Mucilaginibacter corticis]TSJ36506.1 hypothetical protein FO440_21990 [Mucilaginibacter corticis]